MRSSASDRLWQLKITLNGVEPPIWRRIQIKDCTLAKLHYHLQLAMGWQNAHLYQFASQGVVYSDPDMWDAEFDKIEDARVLRLSEFVRAGDERARFSYEYDFGDSWQHEVLFEECQQAEKGERYPQCVAGARACPPEDVGGVYGFVEYLDAIANANHQRHKELLAWRGAFDPEAFDAEAVTKRMQRGFPRLRAEDYI